MEEIETHKRKMSFLENTKSFAEKIKEDLDKQRYREEVIER